MKITFKLIKETEVGIFGGNKQIGRIKTPAGTSGDKPNGIQICGWSSMVEMWGCGLYGTNKGEAKRDVQLLFQEDSQPKRIEVDLGQRICARCFYPYPKCKCLEMVKELETMAKEIKKHYKLDRRRLMLDRL